MQIPADERLGDGCAVPDRSTAWLAGSESPLAPLRDGLLTLASWGADLLAVPCNTAHLFIEKFIHELPVPLVHIIDATVESALRTSPDGAWLCATQGTVESGIYQRHAQALGYRILVPPPEAQMLTDRTVADVKGNDMPAAERRIADTTRMLWSTSALPVIGVCTELPLAYRQAGLPTQRVISSLRALAEACVAELHCATGHRAASGSGRFANARGSATASPKAPLVVRESTALAE